MLHSLQTVWLSRRLPEGDPLFFQSADYSMISGGCCIYCKEDEHLDGEIRRLHRLAIQGIPGVQPHIDAYLPAVALVRERPGAVGLARRLVLGLPDTPQLGTLPDLCRAIRLMLTSPGTAHEACGWASLTFLQQALPCVRRPTGRAQAPVDGEEQVAICVLLGLLLGLYPKAVRFPPFGVRVALYRRVHCLITSGTVLQCPMLMTLAFMEYCAHVVPAYMPAEEELLLGEQGMAGFFSGCSLVCDAFRQDVLVTGEEDWQEMEAYCAPHVEKHLRTCKNKGRTRHEAGPRPVGGSAPHLGLPYIRPYEVHLGDPSHRLMGAEMAFLGLGWEGIRYEHTAAMQRLIHCHALPENLVRMQLAAMQRQILVCERSALSLATLYVCVACVMSGQSCLVQPPPDGKGGKRKGFKARGECKMDVDTGRLVCSSCQSGSVVSISTLGRIVTLRQNRYYLAPCCGSVRQYAGIGDEFNESANETCRHRQGRPAARSGKHRCELCANLALPEGLSRVDHLTGVFRTVRLCQRHTPHEDSLGHVVNWRQLEAEVLRRDRPLFRAER